MSKVVIQGNASGTGNFTIAAPNSNTDRTFNLPDATGTVDRLERAGNVLQVVQTVKTDTFSVTGTTWTDITGYSVNITPSSSSNKILVLADLSLGTDFFYTYARLLRDSTPIHIGDTAGDRPLPTATTGWYAGTSYDTYGLTQSSIQYLDSPATTSQITYKFQMRHYSTNTGYLNRTAADRNSTIYDPRTASTITVMEIAG
jgi:hypothetical protein